MSGLDTFAEADRISAELLADLRAGKVSVVNLEIIEQRVGEVVGSREPGYRALVDRTVRRCVERAIR